MIQSCHDARQDHNEQDKDLRECTYDWGSTCRRRFPGRQRSLDLGRSSSSVALGMKAWPKMMPISHQWGCLPDAWCQTRMQPVTSDSRPERLQDLQGTTCRSNRDDGQRNQPGNDDEELEDLVVDRPGQTTGHNVEQHQKSAAAMIAIGSDQLSRATRTMANE